MRGGSAGGTISIVREKVCFTGVLGFAKRWVRPNSVRKFKKGVRQRVDGRTTRPHALRMVSRCGTCSRGETVLHGGRGEERREEVVRRIESKIPC